MNPRIRLVAVTACTALCAVALVSASAAVGESQVTVTQDQSGVTNDTPETVQGTDGREDRKRYTFAKPAAKRPEPRPEPKPTPEPRAPEPRVLEPVEQPKPDPEPKPEPEPEFVTLAPVTALFDQSAIDAGSLTTWMTEPTCLLAGHDTMGWAWLDDLAVGTRVKVTTGPCAGEYEVTGHEWQAVKGGPVPAWMSEHDLILQTCTGAVGTGFSTATRVD